MATPLQEAWWLWELIAASNFLEEEALLDVSADLEPSGNSPSPNNNALEESSCKTFGKEYFLQPHGHCALQGPLQLKP